MKKIDLIPAPEEKKEEPEPEEPREKEIDLSFLDNKTKHYIMGVIKDVSAIWENSQYLPEEMGDIPKNTDFYIIKILKLLEEFNILK